jgi:hypothetical protein
MDTKPFEIFTRSPLWAIRPEAIETLLQLSSPWKIKDWAEGWGVAPPSVLDKGNTTASKVAVIPIRGVLTKDGPAWYQIPQVDLLRTGSRVRPPIALPNDRSRVSPPLLGPERSRSCPRHGHDAQLRDVSRAKEWE